MRKLTEMARRFRQDEDGAAMIEYSVLIGIITVGVIALVGFVATQVINDWTALCTAMNGGVACS